MASELIYRVEKDKTGPYRWKSRRQYEFDDLLNQATYDNGVLRESHRPPTHDPKMSKIWYDMLWPSSKSKDYVFGFRSINDTRNWFHCDKLIRALDDCGFEFSAFHVKPEDMIVGTHQVAFKRRYKRRAWIKPVSYLLEIERT